MVNIVPLGYALFTSLATVAGGLLPLYTWVKRFETRYLEAFAAGAMVAIAFFEMIPEMGEGNAWVLASGFFTVYIISMLVTFHACGYEECDIRSVGWTAVIGIAIESLVDGVAIGVGYAVEPSLGLIIAGAVFIHEAPRGFTTAVVMKGSQYRQRWVLGALAIDAGFTPLGAIFANVFPQSLLPALIAFAAGTFIYVGASDLLPDAHRRLNFRVIGSLLGGAAIIPILGTFVHL
ncbi:MAG: ZIP family metal transporter [Chloroflexi bacterium]|nr:ZIP family metal transporter [Chloroflexota bacterium]